MNQREELDELEVIERYIILLLGTVNRPVPSREHLQKELFILSRTNPKIARFITFEKHYEGPYSLDIDELLRNPMYYPEAYQIDKNGRCWLTTKGKEIYGDIVEKYSENPRFRELISIMKMIRNMYEKLSKEELLFLIYITYPEYREKSNISDKLLSTKKRKELSKRLLQKGVITEERYKELVRNNDQGDSRQQFLHMFYR